jgi:hypothetical protein
MDQIKSCAELTFEMADEYLETTDRLRRMQDAAETEGRPGEKW